MVAQISHKERDKNDRRHPGQKKPEMSNLKIKYPIYRANFLMMKRLTIFRSRLH